MSLRKNKNFGRSNKGNNSSKDQSQAKRVIDIILDINHPKYHGASSIGIIFFEDEKSGETTNDIYSLPIAKPINRNSTLYPLKGEIVHVIQSTTNNYYKDLEGDPNNINNYYHPPLSIHNNTTNNSLPKARRKKKRQKSNNTTIPTSLPSFEFKSEFTNANRYSAERELNNYLKDLGYSLGRSDSTAPKYSLFQLSNGNYVFRLDESEENKIKLGYYFKENPNQRSLTPTEGDLIQEGRNGQRIRFTTTGPEGKNIISNNVTDVEDTNTSIGDSAILISVGEGENENPNLDAGSIYVLENQSVPIVVSSNNIDSLNSTYTKVEGPLVEIGKPPPEVIPTTPLATTLNVQEVDFEEDSSPDPVIETITSPSPEPVVITEEFDDPVFAALAEAQEEGLITFKDHTFPEIIFTYERPDPLQPSNEDIESTDPNYTPPEDKPTFYPPYPYTGASPNADRLREVLDELGNKYREKVIDKYNIGELSNGGDMDSGVVDYVIAILRKINELMPSLKIVLTGGNDQFHHKLSYVSRHASGRGCDFVISPSSEENIRQVDTILRGFLAGNYPAAAFINEYDSPTKAASGKHFHVSWREDGGTEANQTKQEALAQAEAGEISIYTV
tara:strand:- start:14450 stop:16297 length:1848 start_codon:yes stop_codon:yes gene_type:complete